MPDFHLAYAAAGKNEGTNVSVQFLQWTFASSPRNPLLHYVLGRVAASIVAIPFAANDKATLERTGPKIFSRAILDFIGEYGSTTGFDDSNHRHPRALLPAEELEQHFFEKPNTTIQQYTILLYELHLVPSVMNVSLALCAIMHAWLAWCTACGAAFNVPSSTRSTPPTPGSVRIQCAAC